MQGLWKLNKKSEYPSNGHDCQVNYGSLVVAIGRATGFCDLCDTIVTLFDLEYDENCICLIYRFFG